MTRRPGRSLPRRGGGLSWLAVLLWLAGPAAALDARLEMAKGDLRDAVEAGSLVLGAAQEKQIVVLDVVAAARADYGNILSILYGAGYYGGTIHIRLDGREVADLSPFTSPASLASVVVSVDPGPRFTFGKTAIAPLAPKTRLPRGFAPGKPAESDVIRSAVSAAVDGWREVGHAKARAADRRIVANHPTATLDAEIAIAPGPRLTFGRLVIAGNQAVRTARIRDIAGLRTGRVFSPEDLATVGRRLRQTGAFKSVALEEAETPNPDGSLDIGVTLVEEAPRRFGIGAEISSFEGLALTGFWMHRNIFGGAERLRFDAEVRGIQGDTGGIDYRLAASFARPGTFSPANTLNLRAEFAVLDEPDYFERLVGVEANIAREISVRTKYSFGLAYQFSQVSDDLGDRTFALFSVPLTAEHDRRDNPLNPKTGFYLAGRSQPVLRPSRRHRRGPAARRRALLSHLRRQRAGNARGPGPGRLDRRRRAGRCAAGHAVLLGRRRDRAGPALSVAERAAGRRRFRRRPQSPGGLGRGPGPDRAETGGGRLCRLRLRRRRFGARLGRRVACRGRARAALRHPDRADPVRHRGAGQRHDVQRRAGLCRDRTGVLRPLLALMALLALLSGTAAAQDSQTERDRDFLTRLIEDNLSGNGTEVQIFGFAGALSSQARFDRLTIADDQGIWLTVEDARLDWSRSALLRGSLEVAELSAGRIALDRIPASGGGADLPRLTARDFALPDLPVAVHVDKIAARSLELGPAVLGEPVTASFEGAVALEDGTGSARLDLHRTDGREGQAVIAAEYSNQTRYLDLSLQVTETAGGVVARLLDLPDRPALDFTIAGAGPLSDYKADIALDTGGASRVGGTLRLDDRDDIGSQGFGLELAGDVAPLFQPAYRPFFGDNAEFKLSGVQKADGGTAIDALSLHSEELRLDGTLLTAPDGLPESFRISGALRPTGPDGALLPLPGPPLRIGAGQIEAAYDAATGAAWSLNASVSDLRRGSLVLGSGSLTGSGTIDRAGRSEEAVGAVSGLVSASLGGLATGDPALDAALTERLTAGLRFAWTAGAALEVTEAKVTAGATVLSGAASLDGASRNFRVTGQGQLTAPDLTVFAGLYGDRLGGAAEAALDGWYEPLGGAFDLTLDTQTTALDLGPALPLRLLSGDGRFTGGLARSVAGITANDLKLATPALSATLTGGLSTEAGQLTLDARLTDIAEVAPGLSGPATLAGTLGRSGETLTLDLQAAGPPAVTARLTGTAQADFSAADITFDAAVADLAALVPALAGPATAKGTLTLADDRLSFAAETAAEPGLSASLNGTAGRDLSDLEVGLKASLADLAVFVPQLPGPVEASGTVRRGTGPFAVDLTGTALGRADFALTGTAAADLADVDLHLTGTAPLDLAAPFAPGVDLAGLADLDLALRGAPGLDALSGAVSTLDARVAIGDLALEGLAGRLTLDPAAMTGGTRLAAGIRITRATVVAPGQAWTGLLSGPVAGDATLIVPDAGPLRFDDLRLVNGDAVLTGQATVALDPLKVSAAANLALGSLGRLSDFVGIPLAGQAAAQLVLTHDPAAGRTEVTAEGTTTALRAGSGPAYDLLAGDGSFAVALTVGPEGLRIGSARLRTPALTASAEAADGGALTLDASLDSLGRIVPQLPGAVRVTGTVTPRDDRFSLDLSASGPGGIALETAGTVASSGDADLTIAGTAPLGIANAFLAPALEVQGVVTLNLALNGPPSIAALSGTARTSGAQAVLPGPGLSLTGIEIEAALANGTARITAAGQPREGGRIQAQGSLGLTAPYPVDLSLGLDQVVYSSPPTLKTSASGDLALSGAILSGGALSGRIVLGETTVNLALGSSGGTLADVQHRGATAEVLATRRRAGLDQRGAGVVGGKAQLALDVTVSAPNRIFVRGRGLDAELGGELQITGRTGAVVPIGSFKLIRGRLDILGRRLDLTEGELLLQGSVEPTVRLVASTTAEDVSVQIVTEGAATAPVVSLTSTPDLPEDEILALLLFGRGLDKISAFQALQLANAVRTLLGNGGEGIVGNIRSRFGLDDLDVGTDANGNVAVRAGKYISENAYADVSVNAKGESQVELNLDITPNLTARGRAGSTGETGLGLFFEKDY